MKTKQNRFTELLDSDLFRDNKETVTRIEKTQETRTYKNFPVHLFPLHPKAPYISDDGLFSKHGATAQYTANFLIEYEAKNGCPQESKDDRMYIALMARARINLKNDPKGLEETMMIIEDAAVPGIAKRYGWDQEYVRKGILPACVNAMISGFNIENGLLLKLYESLLESRSRK